MRFVPGSTDVLASRAKLGVIVPSTNSTVGPEYEMLRPHGVTHHIGRMVLPPRPYDNMDTYRQALEHEEGGLHEALEVLMNCEPHAVAHGHSIHSFRGTIERAEELLADVLYTLDSDPIMTFATPDAPDLEEIIGSAKLIVNATTLGWHGNDTPLPARFLNNQMTVYDMVYRPTQLLADAKACGAHGYDGVGMLARQAMLAFHHWTGLTPPFELMRDALLNTI